MAKVYNATAYKISQTFLKEGPEAIKLLDKQYNELVKYQMYVPIRYLLPKIKDAKELMLRYLDSAGKVKNNKGRVK